MWSGSHLDTVPQGGRYDGALGVVAGLETVVRLGRRRRTLAVVAFRDEERGCVGSRARVRRGALPEVFLELHHEQGPVSRARAHRSPSSPASSAMSRGAGRRAGAPDTPERRRWMLATTRSCGRRDYPAGPRSRDSRLTARSRPSAGWRSSRGHERRPGPRPFTSTRGRPIGNASAADCRVGIEPRCVATPARRRGGRACCERARRAACLARARLRCRPRRGRARRGGLSSAMLFVRALKAASATRRTSSPRRRTSPSRSTC